MQTKLEDVIEESEMPSRKMVKKEKINFPQMRGEFQSYHLNVMCNFVKKLMDLNGDKVKVIEIGSYTGESTFIFSHYFDKVLAVDNWENGNSIEKEMGEKAPDMELVFQAFLNRTHNIENVGVLRTSSQSLFSEYMDGNLGVSDLIGDYNMIYIDGDHSPEGVKHDIEMAIKLRTDYLDSHPEGSPFIISGHDFSDGWQEVKNLVRHYFDSEPLVTFQDGSWCVLPESIL